MALLALMLAAQTASAAHAVDHQSLDHTELCQIFKTADSSAAIEIPAQQLDLQHYADRPRPWVNVAVSSSLTLQHCARAPPQL